MEVIRMNISIDHDKVIKKLMAGEKLSDVEQMYVNKKLEAQKKTEDAALEYQAKLNLLVTYAKAHYEPTKEEIKKEKDRIIANRK